jgi:hypothetical protein
MENRHLRGSSPLAAPFISQCGEVGKRTGRKRFDNLFPTWYNELK